MFPTTDGPMRRLLVPLLVAGILSGCGIVYKQPIYQGSLVEPEAVEQLRAQLALLGVHRADEGDARRVRDRDPVALDGVAAHRGRVEEDVDEVVVEQVDLVDVEDAAVGLGEQTGLVGRLAVPERPAQVEGADDAVLGRTDGQLDEAGRAGRGRALVGAVGAVLVAVGVAAEAAAVRDVLLGQHRGEGADGGRLGGALLAADEDAADLGRDRAQQQRRRQLVGTDERGEGEGGGPGPGAAHSGGLLASVHARRPTTSTRVRADGHRPSVWLGPRGP